MALCYVKEKKLIFFEINESKERKMNFSNSKLSQRWI